MGALSTGTLLRCLPYWYLILTCLVLHTAGYVLYAMATTGWLIMLSKLMSGVYIGAQMTLSLAYFGESNVSYCNAIKQQGKDEKKAKQMKHRLFALQSVGVNVGYIFGPGILYIYMCNNNIYMCEYSCVYIMQAWFYNVGLTLNHYVALLFSSCRCCCYICTATYQSVPINWMVQCCIRLCDYYCTVLPLQGRE